MTTRILIIDENPDSLKRYQDALAPKSSQWKLDCAQTANDGILAAKERAPDIVIAALSTNQGHGADILSNLEQILPDAQLFIAATEADKPKLESTFGASFQYLPSPCPTDRLISEIQRCIAIDNWLGNDRIKQLVANMGEFPSLPAIYLKVVNQLNSRDASADSIADAIAGDLAISAKVLQTVNSSYYGFDEKISDIAQAVGILGTDCVKNLVLAIQVFNKMGRSAEHKAVTDQLWHHSMSVAVAARRITAHETRNNKAAEEAYSAGLMHDIGKLVLLNAAPEQFTAARELAHQKTIPLHQAEDQIIGCNHAETGAYLLARWGMPANLTEAVALHHDPVNSFGKSFSALAAVHVANAIVHHRQRPDHPEAAPSEEFIKEIGKAESWDTWVDVSTGKTPSGPSKSKLSLKAKQPEQDLAPSRKASPDTIPADKDVPAQKTSNKTPDAPSQKLEDQPTASQTHAEPERKRKTPLFALAACAALAALGIYTLNTFETEGSLSPNTAEAQPPTFADKIEKAREIAGLTETEDALEEIFDSQETATPNETPEPPPPATKVAAAETPQPPETEKETAPLPKPKLPDTADVFPNIELAGIFYNADRPLASVNGKIRKVGDTVSGVRIIRIEKSQIVVQHEKKVKAIKLN